MFLQLLASTPLLLLLRRNRPSKRPLAPECGHKSSCLRRCSSCKGILLNLSIHTRFLSSKKSKMSLEEPCWAAVCPIPTTSKETGLPWLPSGRCQQLAGELSKENFG